MGFPVPGQGGGGGLTNAYAFLTDGVNTASAVGSDTIDFTSPDGSILFTIVPGSPGVVQAKVASGGGLANAYAHISDGVNIANAVGADTTEFISPGGTILFTVVPGSPGIVHADIATPTPKRLLYSAGSLANVNSIAGSASLIGGAQTVLPASTLAVGDLLHMHAIGTVNNTSGSTATISVDTAINGNGDNIHIAKTMVTGSNGNWSLDAWGVVTIAAGAVLRMAPVSAYGFLSPTTNLIVLANQAINPGGAGLWNTIMTYTNPVTFDVIGNTNVNSPNMGFTVAGAAIERFATGF